MNSRKQLAKPIGVGSHGDRAEDRCGLVPRRSCRAREEFEWCTSVLAAAVSMPVIWTSPAWGLVRLGENRGRLIVIVAGRSKGMPSAPEKMELPDKPSEFPVPNRQTPFWGLSAITLPAPAPAPPI